MKTKNSIKKLVVAGMASAMIAAAVGSISGTVAWFQYNTRATAAYSGATAKCTENLQIRIYDADLYGPSQKKYADLAAYKAAFPWGSDLTSTMISNYIKAKRGAWDASANAGAGAWVDGTTTSLTPVTSGNLALNDAATTFYKNPDLGLRTEKDLNLYTNWEVDSKKLSIVEIPLQLRLLDVDGDSDSADGRNYIAKDLFLSDLTIAAKTVDGKKDITNALRVSFTDNAGTPNKKTFSKTGAEVTAHGQLDLDHDGNNDYAYVSSSNIVKYDVQGESSVIDYGRGTGDAPVAKSTKIETGENKPIADVTGTKRFAPEGDVFGTLVAGHDSSAENSWFTVTVRIYLEGWTPLDGYGAVANQTLWDDTAYIGSEFYVGMEFAVAAIK